MQRVSLSTIACPIARSLDQVGDWWSVLILRDVTLGFHRFAELQERLPIAPNILSRRLEALRRHGLLERRRYAAHPPRHAYHPTAKALDFVPVLLALGAWGNRWLAPRGAPLVNVHPKTHRRIEPIVVDRRTRVLLRAGNVAVAAGPGAPPSVRRSLKNPRVYGEGPRA
jgi:DNA-binding HxlR family transcriptional regulator